VDIGFRRQQALCADKLCTATLTTMPTPAIAADRKRYLAYRLGDGVQSEGNAVDADASRADAHYASLTRRQRTLVPVGLLSAIHRRLSSHR
jgi:hypothetical protein